MSRKRNTQQPPADTGGLNLEAPPSLLGSVAAIATTRAEVMEESRADAAVEELESLPPAQTLEPKTEIAAAEPELAPGMTLYNAIQQSPYLHMAARETSKQEVVVVSNGQLFWTALREGLTPAFWEGMVKHDTERVREDWRPVMGNEKGLYIA